MNTRKSVRQSCIPADAVNVMIRYSAAEMDQFLHIKVHFGQDVSQSLLCKDWRVALGDRGLRQASAVEAPVGAVFHWRMYVSFPVVEMVPSDGIELSSRNAIPVAVDFLELLRLSRNLEKLQSSGIGANSGAAHCVSVEISTIL